MSYSTDPVEDAERHISAEQRYSDALAAAEDSARAELIAAANAGDSSALCAWAPRTKSGEPIGQQRLQQLHEVMHECIELGDAPSYKDLMQLVLDAANGKPDVQAKAKGMVKSMADVYVSFFVNPSDALENAWLPGTTEALAGLSIRGAA